ncbi:ABC transporter ATP-binding protein [Thermosediminibacter oceani]|uniref:ABC transporter related protein n=1 Tax=Thermosediminibacter oceani (strain ATCC BAA-1034 / DSM 16646 / JW/IW-1228P) TaxID=555079 RepID=D9RYF9_THEOJ|nr:ABC transporter ATP-binding protein [Thermosediminibacter oceani]ADL08383.1 ABC transporter related protein [Thermosediminibacter oceani DSM 16646]
MNGFHEDELQEKPIDLHIFRRLLKYARPYAALMVFCILLLMVVTAADLAQPYIVRSALDGYINAFKIPYLEVPRDKIPPGAHTVSWHDKTLVRSSDLSQAPPGATHYRIVEQHGKYYLVQGFAENGNVIIETVDGEIVARQGEKLLKAFPLDPDELKRFRARDVEGLTRLSLIFVLILFIRFAVNYVQVYLLQYAGQNIILNLRKEIFSHIENMHLSYFDKNPVGRLVTRVTNDTETLNEMYTSVLVNLFKDLFLLLGIIIVMMRMNFRMAIAALSVAPIIAVATVIFRNKAREAYREVRKKIARINATLSENITGMKVIQIFNREAKKFAEFDRINREYYLATMRELQVFAVFRPFLDLVYYLSLSLLIWYGGPRVIRGMLSFGTLYAFVHYMGQFFQPINDLAEKFNILQSAMASSERIFQVLDTESPIKDPSDPVAVGRFRGEIEFRNVWFAYEGEDWVLKDVSFKVEPGETVALVGATGAGKTSIINLICRFYDVNRGQILVDGVDIRDMRQSDLRRQIGVVQQDVFLFSGDIKYNIRLNDTEIDDEKIREVARYTNAHRFIETKPNKYDEEVTERGGTLSAGQRQLLAFARALAFDPAILILDEATSAVDTETESLIQDALEKITRGRTTIIIAHRLSTVQHADKIIVLHKGRIRECGTHEELLEKRGLYYKLYLLQFKENRSGTN